jgi:lipoate---protein ligase
MKYLDLTLPDPAANLALDEALLNWCEEGNEQEILRFWEPSTPFVVVGYGNEVEREVNVQACHQKQIPVLRRCSGGGTVLQGHGCLNYAVILRIELAPALASIPGTNRYVMNKHRELFERLAGKDIAVRGHTDLAVGLRKFSGNSQRRRRQCLLFHGTFLLTFDLGLIQDALPLPSKQPAYRADRSHIEFLTNVAIPPFTLKEELKSVWSAKEALAHWPSERVTQLVEEKYGRADWNCKF